MQVQHKCLLSITAGILILILASPFLVPVPPLDAFLVGVIPFLEGVTE